MARKGFKIADAYVEIHADRDGLRDDVKKIPGDVGGDADKAGTEVGKKFGKGVGKGAGPEADRAGRDGGGKLAKGFQMSFLRNSPLIVAAIGGALAAGAPLMLAGVTALFAGIGAVSAAQNDKVKSAWIDLWDTVKTGAQEDAAVLVPVYERMALKIGASFTRMRPQIREAFADSAPLIDRFTNSLTKSAENALPGFVRAIQRGGPVMAGFGSFVEDTGTGLTKFFDNMSEHSPAAGKAFDALGRIVAALLPILGDLMGQGSELASIILPPLASALEVVADALHAIGPALPAIVMGFTAMKVARTATGWITGLGASVEKLAARGPGWASVIGRSGSTLTGLGGAAGLAGGAVALLTIAFARGKQETEDWGNKTQTAFDQLSKGGLAAVHARDQLDAMNKMANDVADGGFMVLGDSALADKMDEIAAATHRAWAEMSPLEQAQSKLAEWTATLSYRLNDENASASDVAIAQQKVKQYSAEVTTQNGLLEQSIHGVTQAMVEQTNQAMSAIDSSFAYQNALDQNETQEHDLAVAIRDHGRASEEADDAQRALAEGLYATAKAFGQQQADLSNAKQGTEEYTRISQQGMLQELYRLRDAAGPQMAAALQQQINTLQASGLKLDATAAKANETRNRMEGLGLSVTNVPGFKGVNISAPTADQAKRISDLGYRIVHLPDGSVYVALNDADARARLQALTNTRFVTIFANLAKAAGGGATGGQVRDVAGRGFAAGGTPQRRTDGQLVGPGGPLDDLIGAITNTGELIRVANSEWIVPGAVGSQQGNAKMRALVAGNADIVPRGRSVAAARMPTGSGSGSSSIHIGTVTIPINGVVDLSDARELKKLGERIREIIIGLEREQK